ncbi:MAG: RNA 2',3'-cyclic phosphodiesterase [Gemmatimonadales bacterium]
MRLFVALNFPTMLRDALWDAGEPLRRRAWPVNWVRPEGLHLTLKFLGEVEPDREPALVAALGAAAAGARSLPLAVGGFGVFPDLQRPRVLWVGISADPALELLQHRVEQEFAPLGFPTEPRAFRPHLTLGRARKDARPADFTGLTEALAGLAFERTAVIATVDLMQSTLQSGGAVYQVRHGERLS